MYSWEWLNIFVNTHSPLYTYESTKWLGDYKHWTSNQRTGEWGPKDPRTQGFDDQESCMRGVMHCSSYSGDTTIYRQLVPMWLQAQTHGYVSYCTSSLCTLKALFIADWVTLHQLYKKHMPLQCVYAMICLSSSWSHKYLYTEEPSNTFNCKNKVYLSVKLHWPAEVVVLQDIQKSVSTVT